MSQKLTVVRGAGDLATGVLYVLHQFGYRVAATECAHPSSIRRTVSFCEAVYDGTHTVEGVTAMLCRNPADLQAILADGKIPVLVDPEGAILRSLSPDIVVDATLAKKNLGNSMDMAPIVIGVGPGFTAGKDVHAVVETRRGHNLGRVILNGQAEKDTGVPGSIGGYSRERVLYAPKAGVMQNQMQIGEHVDAGGVIALVDGTPVTAQISGILRGLIRDGYAVTPGFKIADVDPRNIPAYCLTVSDKARLVGFGVLAAIQTLKGV